jgi:D-alanine-D-alanine ligase-like ATP-grasp enzyme
MITKEKVKSKKVEQKTASKVIRKPTSFYLRILSRHPSIVPLRDNPLLIRKVKAVYRHGSTTDGKFEYEINSVESIKTSADKKLMKEAFDKAEIKHAPWIHLKKYSTEKKVFDEFLGKLEFGKDKESWIIIKNRWGSRGTGNTLVKTQQELDAFIKGKTNSLDNYIIEEYKNYTVEYRIHATEEEYFYTCRKMLKSNTPKEQRFQRHDDNCEWFLENNPKFNKPENWNDIVEDCKKAVKTMGADVLAFDVKCTSVKDAKDKKCKYIIIESCSAPSFGKVTMEKYREQLPKILYKKYGI